jgi:hypothetical protein
MGAQTAWIEGIGGCLVFGPNKQGSDAASRNEIEPGGISGRERKGDAYVSDNDPLRRNYQMFTINPLRRNYQMFTIDRL